MIVLKFGGSSLSSPLGLKNAAGIIRQASRRERVAVVVSALSGVTDDLILAAKEAAKQDWEGYSSRIEGIKKRYHNLFKSIGSKKQRSLFEEFLETTIKKIGDSLNAIANTGESTPRVIDRLAGEGEILSAHFFHYLLSLALNGTVWDTRQLIVTDDFFNNANVLFPATIRKIRRAWQALKSPSIPIITGFIGATESGIPTTLGRNGSDYTASIVGAALKAREIQIWSDVDGIMSADPRLVGEAFVLKRLSFDEVSEMAYFGAKIVHPKAMIPAFEGKISLRIKNTFRPEREGTLITAQTKGEEGPVRGVTAMENVSLIRIEGCGMQGVPGTASRLFEALAQAKINVIMISQASSEHSICFVVREEDSEAAKRVVQKSFRKDLERKNIKEISVQTDVAVVAIIGEGMRGRPGISGRLFGVLGKNGVNVLAIAQGSSEKNITIVVARREAVKALNIIHSAFHLSRKRVHLFVIGKGVIGSKLLEQIGENQERILKNNGLQLKLVGIADSQHKIFFKDGFSPKDWKRLLQKSRSRWDEKELARGLKETGLENVIVVDVTPSEKIARLYTELLKEGISVVTPNKRANTFPYPFYREIQSILNRRNSYYMYETCVGAGLPVISTLKDLVNSGDEILEIQGIFSGTLSYVFSELEKGKPLQEIVRKALALGYTEPDPREDLSGMDVARKILILAREIGFPLELKNIRVENLVPARYRLGPVAAFLKGLEKENALYQRRVREADQRGRVLRYVGRLKKKNCCVLIEELKKDSPLARIRPGDNIVIFKTKRYFDNPLIVQGPGAGPDVTAGGLFADILKVAHWLT